MNPQIPLQNKFIVASPLKDDHFEGLYKVAADPLIWIQHPNQDRYKREVFEIFFKHALKSKGAYLIQDALSKEIIGSSRFYDFNYHLNSTFIGYTFFKRTHWGSKFNYSCKILMLDHAFKTLNKVIFHIGKFNIRSQRSIERLGAKWVKEIEIPYAGEPLRLNYEYEIEKKLWPDIRYKLVEYFNSKFYPENLL
ncbi:MAG: GNAT family N-acetyltransferase [Saprospiraceae bacterium]|nr:GNAT family N-acetyltransferase [Saprospiraceae bacterium]